MCIVGVVVAGATVGAFVVVAVVIVPGKAFDIGVVKNADVAVILLEAVSGDSRMVTESRRSDIKSAWSIPCAKSYRAVPVKI